MQPICCLRLSLLGRWKLCLGSGILFSSNGYFVTNNHVIANAVSVEVTLFDDRTYEAALVGYDIQTDLAVLKIDAEGLTPAVFGDSDALQIGETVVAIGNPIGPEYRNTMTDGILSAIGREVTVDGYSMLLLQTNAAINEGNSGGPLFNIYGQVIGITNMKIASPYLGVEGIGFSIPSNTVVDIVRTLVQQGSIPRGSIGITLGEFQRNFQNITISLKVYTFLLLIQSPMLISKAFKPVIFLSK